MGTQSPQAPISYGDLVPAELRRNLDALNAARAQATQPSGLAKFTQNHPILTGLGALALAGPSGLMLPGLINQGDQRRRALMEKAYNDAITGQLGQYETMDKLVQPRAEAAYTNQLQQAGMDADQVNPDTPKIPQGIPFSSGFLKDTLSGTFAPGNLAALPTLLRSVQSGSMGLGQSAINPVMPATPGLAGTGLQDATLTAIPSGPMQASASMTDPSSLPIYMDPTLAGSIGNNLTSAANTGLTQGVEAGKANATLTATVQKLIAEGRAAEALALLRGAQTQTEKQRPAQVRAETNRANADASLKNRTDPNLRSGGNNDPLTSENRFLDALKKKRDALVRQGMSQGWVQAGKNSNLTFTAPQPLNSGWFNGPAQPNPATAQYNAWREALNGIDAQMSGYSPAASSPTPAASPAGGKPSPKAVSLLAKYKR